MSPYIAWQSSNMELLTILLAVTSLCVLLYRYCVATYTYWKRKGVTHIKPSPLFGNVKDIILRRRCPALVFQQLYNKSQDYCFFFVGSPNFLVLLNKVCLLPLPTIRSLILYFLVFLGERYVGIYQARTPVLLLRDPELIKHILVKDFSCFPSKGIKTDFKGDPLSCHLFNLEGDQWRYIRTKLTPAFTSSKLKIVYQHIDHYSEKLIEHLEDQLKTNDVLDVYSELVNFTMDATGSCAFGIEVDAMTDENSEISKMGHRVIEANGDTFMEILNSISPRLTRLLKVSMFSEDVTRFFKNIIVEIIRYRDENQVMKKDVMQLLMLARNKTCVADDPVHPATADKDEDFDEVMLAAQAAMFLRAGSEKASTTMSFCLNELAHQPELQSQLRAEVEHAKEEHGGKLTYEIVLGLKLMDRVVAETLRKYPLESNIYRVCRKPYTIPDSSVELEEGTKVLIPVYALHHDPQNYPDPERFDPDRFSEDNKNSRDHFTYLPFGEGPRVCIGFRYGVLQVKVGLAALLLNYEFSTCALSTLRPEFNSRTWVTSPANGMWLKVTKR
ncbi:hypothetical protein L9F63_022535 [Diploptera punctata]|uniref:Cytochrome P450 n=1 Tax=Diploptera punctata TaxID=6984 RepID=A0AAD8EAR5_DIPPU|nr:hypothetical protein L9F63_022535 [Diploptera punctata]